MIETFPKSTKEEGKDPGALGSPNPLISEHLSVNVKTGVKPIIISVSPEEYISEPGAEKQKGALPKQEKEAHNVDWYASSDPYEFSPVDEKNKESEGYKNCIGIVLTGKEKGSSKQISCVGHFNPSVFFTKYSTQEKFLHILRSKIEEVKKRSEEGSMDAAVFGGNVFEPDPSSLREYEETIQTVVEESEKCLGFAPVVIIGPKTGRGQDDVSYDTENRRLFTVRKETGVSSSESYLAKDFPRQKKKWAQEYKEKSAWERFLLFLGM